MWQETKDGELTSVSFFLFCSLILDPVGLKIPFSWVLGLGVAFVLAGLLMVASQLRDAREMIATLPQARPAGDPALVQMVAELSSRAGLKATPPLLVLPSLEPNAFAYGWVVWSWEAPFLGGNLCGHVEVSWQRLPKAARTLCGPGGG